MNSNYLFGIFGALVVVALGIFLIGRDGTEEQTIPAIIEPQEEVATLPVNTEAEATTTDEEVTEPETESDADDDASEEAEELSDEGEEVDVPNIVTYTDAGFSPKTLTINVGEDVTFVNNSSRNMWVASDVHPTHNQYPVESDSDCLGSSFDACTGTPVGQSWVFVFTEEGEWGYHDHLNASRTGTIEVE